jgi:hypothetical protein
LIPSDVSQTPIARRLAAIQEFNELGAAFVLQVRI